MHRRIANQDGQIIKVSSPIFILRESFSFEEVPGGHQSSSFAPDPRSYPQQYGYGNRPSTSPSMLSDLHDSRTLPPLNVSPMQGHSGPSNAAMGPLNMRSPTSGYPAGYTPYPQNPQSANSSYPYVQAPDPRNLPPALPQMGFDPASGAQLPRRTSMSVERTVPGRLSSVHGPSPYARGPPTMPPSDYAPEPQVSEPMIKKKRKRADAEQLKVLNETYNRTAFPSTEERIELAKKLGMSARSVQIWSVLPFPGDDAHVNEVILYLNAIIGSKTRGKLCAKALDRHLHLCLRPPTNLSRPRLMALLSLL